MYRQNIISKFFRFHSMHSNIYHQFDFALVNMPIRKQNSAPSCKPMFLNSSDFSVDYSARTEYTTYYKKQSQKELKNKRHNVSIRYDDSLHSSWKPHLKQAIRDINTAAPGLYLHETYRKNKEDIHVLGFPSGNPNCIGDIRNYGGAKVNLANDWSNKKQASIHELLHALGIGHEHQRHDSKKSLAVESTGKGNMDNFQPRQDFHGITRFDPFSIMLYCEGEYEEAKVKRNGDDPVWAIVPPGEKNNTLSELDKLGLNLLYPPCRTGSYQPSKSHVTGK